MKHYEDAESMALMDWSCHIPTVCDRLIHIPNGGRRNKREAARLKRMGVRPGVSDYFLPVARGVYHGLWIELKASPPNRARTSKAQLEWIADMIHEGYAGFVMYGWVAAKDIILEYMLLSEDEEFRCLM